jgi:hypothetical protein
VSQWIKVFATPILRNPALIRAESIIYLSLPLDTEISAATPIRCEEFGTPPT